MRTRSIDLGLSVLGSAAALLLSWPYWRDFEYWAESPIAWQVYFVVGFLLAVYVFMVFIRSLRTLFEHDALEHAEAAAARPGQAVDGEDAP
ncbi:MAG TPA: hypothetical protein PK743_11140 [Luteimonas sp.]|nr:hypothetical protein [Luteimonas sp.]HRO26854.1 hypothetical protein [Luteimonas sp.]HRP73175.1 hypothetical protein [Luteimonas sp.]